jgi:arabinofuranan 3-O-arabinosyltransferase
VRRTVRPGTGDTVVALRENTNPGWVARQGGRVLRPVVLDGWQQGWQLRGVGPVRVDFAPDRAYRIGLAVGLGALMILVVLVAAGWRRPTSHLTTPAAAGTRLLPVPLVLGVALVGAGLVAGWGGVALAVAAGLLSRLLVRRWPEEAPWLLAVPTLVAALAYVALPWGSASGWAGNQAWPHYLVLVPLVAVLLPADGERRRRWESGLRPFSRSAGRSTNR